MRGQFLVKVFQGEGFDDYRKAVVKEFAVVKSVKPKASRPRSPEVYLLAQGLKISKSVEMQNTTDL
jgi:23S rRNA (uridine2552-2'-O)-methyltransferase